MKRILLVDGDAPALGEITRILADAGYQVRQAPDGASALREASAQRPDLLLLAVALPGMGGLEVMRQLKAIAGLADLPVILLGPAAGEPGHPLPAETGADDFMDRPFSVQTLLARVRLQLRHSETVRALRAHPSPGESALLESHQVLREQATLLLTAQRLGRMGGWSIDLRTGRLRWSQATLELFGVEPAQFVGTYAFFYGMILPEDRPAYDAAHARTGPATPMLEARYRIRRPDGEVRWMHERGSIEFDAAGQAVARVGMVMDITLQRAKSEQQEQDAAMLRIASKAARLGGWTLELPQHTLTWSDENCAIHEVPAGYRPTLEEGIGLFAPQHRAVIQRHVQACEQDGTPYDIELSKFTVKGRQIWVRCIGEAVRDGQGRIIRLQGAFQDITERKQAEEALRASEERFRLLALSSDDAIWDWDIARDAVWWNEGFEILAGVPADTGGAGWTAWAARLHPQDRNRVVAGRHEAVRGGFDRWSDSYRFQRADGTYADISDRGSVVRDGAGVAVRMIGSMTDVTVRLQLEEQLRQSHKLESVGQLTGGVAHDFNNLLTVILGNTEMLSEQLAGNARLAPLADMAVDAALRGAELTQRLLAFARRQALAPRALDVNGRVEGMDAILRRTLGEHIEIRFEPGAGLWPALVDPAQLDNALLNLCLNARDAMAGGGRLTVATANTQLHVDQARHRGDVPPGDYVMLSVADNGRGIPAHHLSRVFEPFFTTKETGKGTGLGLSMIYGFVRQSDGYVTVSSEPGEGTTVRLYLPRALEADAPAPPAVRAGRVVGGTENVLLVEDDELVRRYAYDQLLALGYQVRQAGDGAQALAILGAHSEIELLFTDVVMPGMSGRQLADRARVTRPALKVLYASGYAENEIVHQGRLDPDAQLLPKPYRRDELARRVRMILDAR